MITLVDQKKIKEKTYEALEPIYVATHPTRSNILTQLESQKMYASKLEEKIAVDRKIISFHLSKLEKAGLVASEYGLMTSTKTRPMAVRYYSLTSEGEKMVKKLKELLSD